MSYNIEDHEDELKKTPYELDEEQWQRLQQRIRAKVIPGKVIPLQQKRMGITWWITGSVAAALILFFTLLFPYYNQPGAGNRILVTDNAEQRLDKAINSLNQDELDWMHRLNENDISEQDEYMENQVQL